MHGQLELMTMSWTNTDHREDLQRSGRDRPFATVRRKAVASILEAIDLARIQTARQDIRCALAHVTCEYWIHARPQVLNSHLASARLGDVPRWLWERLTIFSVPIRHSPPAVSISVTSDLSVRMEEYRKPDRSSLS